jgi:hypothetical protein
MFLTLLGYCAVLILNFLRTFRDSALLPYSKVFNCKRHSPDRNKQEGNAPVAVGHYGGSLKLDSSGLCEI